MIRIIVSAFIVIGLVLLASFSGTKEEMGCIDTAHPWNKGIITGSTYERGICPICGSKERLTYSTLTDNKERDDWIWIYDTNFYICSKCGNVYAIQEKVDIPLEGE